RRAVTVRRHSSANTRPSSKPRPSLFLSPGCRRRVLSGSASDRECPRRASRRGRFRFQSVPWRAWHASWSCFLQRIHSVLRAHLPPGTGEKKYPLARLGDCLLRPKHALLLVLSLLHRILHRFPYLLRRHPPPHLTERMESVLSTRLPRRRCRVVVAAV